MVICLKRMQLIFSLMLFSATVFAQQANISTERFSDGRNHWYGIRDAGNVVNPSPNQPKYPETEITKIADNILLFQRNNGGWPKNYDMQAILTKEQTDSVSKSKSQNHTTFDNSTTYTHVEYLAEDVTGTLISALPAAGELEGAIVRLTVDYPREWDTLIDEPALRRHAGAAFEFHLLKRPRIDARIRLPADQGISSLGPLELLDHYWRANHAADEDAQALQNLAKSIIEEEKQDADEHR